MMPGFAGPTLIAIGALGVVARAVHFVRVTMPENYGRNPGFGAFEAMAMPWWIVLCVGVGIQGSLRAGALAFVAGFIVLGLTAHLLGRLFGRSP